MFEPLGKMARDLDSRFSEGDLGQPFMSSHNYRTYPFNRGFFRPIPNLESNRRVAFIDGGNCEIVGAPNFSVQFNRTYFNIFHGRRRLLPVKLQQHIQFVSATFATFRGGQVFFDTAISPVGDTAVELLPEPQDLSFNSMDRRLTFGGARADIARVASIARRYAEWRLAKLVVEEELQGNDVLVMDGTLRTAFKNESKYSAESHRAARSKGVVFSGLSKSSRLFTTTGMSLLAALDKLANENGYRSRWRYFPIADSLSPEHEAAIFVARLNEQARHIFRYEIQADQAKELRVEELDEVFSELANNSFDLSFPGYPYGLIDADANARVSRDEVEPYRIMFLSEVSKLGSWLKFARQIRSKDAHSILDALRGR
jgi:hypothetical protein